MEDAPIRRERIETPLEEGIFEFIEEDKIVLLCILRAEFKNRRNLPIPNHWEVVSP